MRITLWWLLIPLSLLFVTACGLVSGTERREQRYLLVSIQGRPLPAPLYVTRVDDGTVIVIDALADLLVLRNDNSFERVARARRVVNGEVVEEMDGGMNGNFTQRNDTLFLSFRHPMGYDETFHYRILEGGALLRGFEDHGRLHEWRRDDAP